MHSQTYSTESRSVGLENKLSNGKTRQPTPLEVHVLALSGEKAQYESVLGTQNWKCCGNCIGLCRKC